jgi:molybdopterin converting factor small subunit
MQVRVQFFSYFKDLTGVAQTAEELPPGATVADLLARLHAQFPKLAALSRSTLVAVGVDYAGRDQVLCDDDEISLFPPVQGG